MTKTILIFIDGVGIGHENPISNPFYKFNWKLFTEVFHRPPSLNFQHLENSKALLFPTDANLGVSGLPQSGTGQTSIFCGVNAPKIVGKHFGPYPYSTLLSIIEEKNIFAEVKRLNKKAVFLNAYPKKFFNYIKSGKKRLSVTSLSCLFSDVNLFKARDLHNGNALSAEINNFRWREGLNYKVPIISPVLAAKRTLRIASKNDFTAFEFFLTDFIGHGRRDDSNGYVKNLLDEYLTFLIQNLDEDFSLIVCSDHGNYEDLSVKTHTRNPALTIVAGKNRFKLENKIKDLSDIKHAILECNF